MQGNTVYVVTLCGLYIHQVCSVEASPEDAIEAAKTVLRGERYDYHHVEIYARQIGVMTARTARFSHQSFGPHVINIERQWLTKDTFEFIVT